MHKVLVLFANPRGSNPIRLGEEDRKIQECIRRGKHRDDIHLSIKHAVTIEDVSRALLDDDFEIVQFSGHGTGAGLAFEDELGRVYVPPREALANLLSDFSPPLTCALLNACYSTSQGALTSLGVPFTVAMEGPIADQSAIAFVGGFYDALAAGKDVEFSYRQGLHALRLANLPDSNVPVLLRQGEALPTQEVTSRSSGRERDAPSSRRKLLLAIGLDVSGSMESRLNNRENLERTRLEGFRAALERVAHDSRDFLRSVKRTGSSDSVFAYVFGLRTGDTCDLFSLVKVAGQIISDSEVESLKRQYGEEIRRRYAGGSGLEGLARSYGLGGFVESAKAALRADAEREVKARILAEVQRRLRQNLEDVGDVTLRLDELADLWEESSTSFEHASDLIFGNTPMCAALRKIYERFARELGDQEAVEPVLVVVSDGDPTDGDPMELAQMLRDLGVTIVCCYITSGDVLEPRTLYSDQGLSWPDGAKLMFQMASTLADGTPFRNHLLRNGWRVPSKARCFVQVNHSDLLEELLGWAISPIEEGYGLLPKGV